MSSEDDRTTATLTAEEETEEADGAWFFNLSDDARRREADLTRDLRRALVDEYRQQDSAKPKRKRLFGILPVGSGDAAADAEAVPAFLPRPQAQREDSSGPVPHRPSMRLAGRAGRRQEEPVEEAAPQEPAWTPRFLREDAEQSSEPLDMPPSAPLRQPPSELELEIDVEEETSDWFDEPRAEVREMPARPRELRRTTALYAGEDDWTTALVPATLTALADAPMPAAAPRAPLADESTPVAEAFMRLAADEEAELEPLPRTPFAARQRGADATAAPARLRTPADDDWHTELLAALASWDASASAARRSRASEPLAEPQSAPDASLASWFDEAFQEDEEAPAAPVNRFAREDAEAGLPAPMPLRRPAPEARALAEDDWTSELTLTIAASAHASAPAVTAEPEPEPEPFGINLRRRTPAAEPAPGGKSRWDEMIESSQGNTGSIVDAMREVWADSAAEEPAPRRKRSLRGPRPEPEQRSAAEAPAEAIAEAAPDAPLARADEPTRLVGKLGGIIRRRRNDDAADSEMESIEAAIEAPPSDSDAEIPATLWKELFGDPDASGEAREPLAFPSGIEHRQGVHTFADPVPAEELPVDEDISLAEIFGEATPAPTAKAGPLPTLDGDDLLPPAPVWVDDDMEEDLSPEAAIEATAAAGPVETPAPEIGQSQVFDEAAPLDAAPEGWTSEPLVALSGTSGLEQPEAPMTDDAEQQVAMSQPEPEMTDPFAAAIADLAADAAEAIDWGDVAGGELPYDIAWPEADGGSAHIDDAPASLAGTATEPGDDDGAALAEVLEERVGPLADSDWQPQGSEPESLGWDAAAGEPEQPEPATELLDVIAEVEPDAGAALEHAHDAMRQRSAYSGFKPIQAAPDEANDDGWEAFFGVEATAPEDDTSGQGSA